MNAISWSKVLAYSDLTTDPPAPSDMPRRRSGGIPADQLLAAILKSLDDDNAQEVVSIDIRGRSTIADHMVICSGRSGRHVTAIAQKLAERLKEAFGINVRSEGEETAEWVLVDAGDVIVHVFQPDVRAFYQLEKIWLPVDQIVSPPKGQIAG